MPATRSAEAPPGARAVARYVLMSASKARRMVNLIRGLPAKEALTVMQFAPQRASGPVYKVIQSAIANAENNEQLDPDSLLISEAYVNEGPTRHGWRPRAQMRPGRLRHRTCHITVYVEAVQPDVPAGPPRRAKRRRPEAAVAPAPAAPEVTEPEPAAPEVTEPAAEETPEKPRKKVSRAAKAAETSGEAGTAKPAKKAAKAAKATETPGEGSAVDKPAKKTARKTTKKAEAE